MLKKIFILGVALIMSLGLFTACANDYEYKETDFKLTISVDKEEASVGEAVVVTVKFENLSGRDIPIKLSPWDTSQKHEIKNLIQIGLFPKNSHYSFDINDSAGRMGKETIKKDAIVQRTMEFIVEEHFDHEAAGVIFFYAGRNYSGIMIYSEIITIKVI